MISKIQKKVLLIKVVFIQLSSYIVQ
uniref:Uncharacterized protein n=1 Tax=Anguilla anguilla TaxID=7936 RepID=A0A0E9XFI9_ANGAN